VKSDLKLDWCSYQAAKYAVEHWHYSRKMPAGKAAHVGAWEGGRFIGCVIFSRGGNNNIGNPFNLKQTQICELTRIALTNHLTPVSRVAAIAVRLLCALTPGLRLVISYADPKQAHHGGIYQAMGWTYVGTSQPQRELLVAGRFMHKRSASAKFGTASPQKIARLTGRQVEYGPIEWKHSYLMPLDAEIARLGYGFASGRILARMGSTDRCAPNRARDSNQCLVR